MATGLELAHRDVFVGAGYIGGDARGGTTRNSHGDPYFDPFWEILFIKDAKGRELSSLRPASWGVPLSSENILSSRGSFCLRETRSGLITL